jgi:hypothetical protein
VGVRCLLLPAWHPTLLPEHRMCTWGGPEEDPRRPAEVIQMLQDTASGDGCESCPEAGRAGAGWAVSVGQEQSGHRQGGRLCTVPAVAAGQVRGEEPVQETAAWLSYGW